MGIFFIDKYSLLHFFSGVALYFFFTFEQALILHIVFEVVENSELGMFFINKFHFWPGGKPCADSILNSIGDTIFAALGWIFMHIIMKRKDKKLTERSILYTYLFK